MMLDLTRLSRSWRIALSVLPFAVHPLWAQIVPAGEGTLRGELVRFPDGSVNVSVFAVDAEAIPPSLWNRLFQAKEVSFLGGGSPEVNESLRIRLAELSGLTTVSVVQSPSELEPVGVQVTKDDQIRLAWYDRTEDQGVAILADGRAADEQFALKILIPNHTRTDDWWGLQAALSKAGIRRVQILSGRP